MPYVFIRILSISFTSIMSIYVCSFWTFLDSQSPIAISMNRNFLRGLLVLDWSGKTYEGIFDLGSFFLNPSMKPSPPQRPSSASGGYVTGMGTSCFFVLVKKKEYD